MLTGTACDDHLSASGYIAAILRFEVALARVQASAGFIPADGASAIEAAAQDFEADAKAVATKGRAAGTPIVELLDQFGARLEQRMPGARAFLHVGATSQDALDTATALCLKPCVDQALAALRHAQAAAFDLARQHASSPMLARTLMQAAGIITFGFKTAHWGAGLARCERRIRDAADGGLCVQLAGAVGSGLAFGGRWLELRSALARELDLKPPVVGTSQAARDGSVNLLVQLGLATGTAAKIAGDIALMSQSEVGEAHEPSADRGVSSALPHKQNPVLCMRIRGCGHVVQGLTASLLSTMVVEHERGLGTWQAELALAPSLVSYAVGALDSLASLLQGLRFDADRAQQNIDAMRGLVFADRAAAGLATVLPKTVAWTVVEDACKEVRDSGGHLRAALEHASAPHRAQLRSARRSLNTILDAAFDPRDAIEAAAHATWQVLDEMSGPHAAPRGTGERGAARSTGGGARRVLKKAGRRRPS
jgi:3-carboxy-cis,cis-muconate cycloisomerase